MLTISPLHLTVFVTCPFATDRERTGRVGGTNLKGDGEHSWVKEIKPTTNRGISCWATTMEMWKTCSICQVIKAKYRAVVGTNKSEFNLRAFLAATFLLKKRVFLQN